MRTAVTAVLIVLPGLASAQPARPPDSVSPPTLAAIGLPLAAIGLPLAPLGLALGPTPTLSVPTPPAAGSRRGRTGHSGRATPTAVYVVPLYGSFGWSMPPGAATPGLVTPPPSTPEPASRHARSRPAEGSLRLELRPRATGQLFLDGAYMGTLDDLGHDLSLPAGTHQLELREPGYQRFELTVRIAEGRALVFRGDLEPLPPPPAPTSASPPVAAPPPPAPIVRKPFYFIPGCYLGDVPPNDAGLPASCDPSRAVIYRP